MFLVQFHQQMAKKQLEIFWDLKGYPSTSQGFKSVAFVVLEIAGGGGGYISLGAWCGYQKG